VGGALKGGVLTKGLSWPEVVASLEHEGQLGLKSGLDYHFSLEWAEMSEERKGV
jgi:hypothetical protein